MRLDALVTIHISHRISSFIRDLRSIPILMYHSITDCPEESRHPYYHTHTTPAAFEDQIGWLKDNHFTTISLDEVEPALADTDGKALERRVVITFDDGYSNVYTQAFPVLYKYGFRCAVFLPTAFIGNTVTNFKGHGCLTWSQVRELSLEGVEFGSHTITHPQLKSMTCAEIENEIRGSKRAIEEELGLAVRSFAYPYAFPATDGCFKRMLREILIDAGYKNGVTTTVGTQREEDDMMFMRRLPINSLDDRRLFAAKLDGAYNWINSLQLASKFARRLVTKR